MARPLNPIAAACTVHAQSAPASSGEWRNVEASTGKDWQTWYRILDAAQGRRKTHRQLTRHLEDHGLAAGWWAQAIVTGYERHVGKREVGQTCTGEWAASARVTVQLDLDGALELWLSRVSRSLRVPAPLASPARVTRSEKFRYWRAELLDGTRVAMTMSRSKNGTALGLQHLGLSSREAVHEMKAFWKLQLSRIRESCAKSSPAH